MINIYVGNLPYATQEDDLIDHFSQWGPVERATLVFDRETGRPRGFGFVEMADDEAGRKAIEASHGEAFNGRPLTVNEARPRGSGRNETPTMTRTALAGEDASSSNGGYRNASPDRRDYPVVGRIEERPGTFGQHRPTGGGYANKMYG
jgi:RNA recognition motif-containing protein